MFEHFTFGAVPQSRCWGQDDISASPTDTSGSPPRTEYPFPPPTSNPLDAIGDIVSRFSSHSIIPDERYCSAGAHGATSIWADALGLPTIDDDFTSDQLCYVSSKRGKTSMQQFQRFQQHSTMSVPQRSPSPEPQTRVRAPSGGMACKRMQRQLNTQLQTCTKHMKDLESLVEEMIESNEQCTITLHAASRLDAPSPTHTTESLPSLSASSSPMSEDFAMDEEEDDLDASYPYRPTPDLDPNEDEGFAEMDDEAFEEEEVLMSLRRAITPSGIGKLSNGGRCRGLLNSLPSSRDKSKIRSLPRMRKRCKVTRD